MIKISIKPLAAVFIVVAFAGLGLLLAAPSTQQPTVTRKILLKQDAPVSGYEEDLVAVEIPSGGREGRHTHPGSVIIYVQEGTLTFDYEGKPTATYKHGDTLYVEPDKIHEGRNLGNTPVKVLATFLVRKGVPLTSPAQ